MPGFWKLIKPGTWNIAEHPGIFQIHLTAVCFAMLICFLHPISPVMFMKSVCQVTSVTRMHIRRPCLCLGIVSRINIWVIFLWKIYHSRLVGLCVSSMGWQVMYEFQTNQIEATMSNQSNCCLQWCLFSFWMQVSIRKQHCSRSHSVFSLKCFLESIARYSFAVVFSVKTEENGELPVVINESTAEFEIWFCYR